MTTTSFSAPPRSRAACASPKQSVMHGRSSTRTVKMVLLGEASALLGTRTLEELWTQSCATIEDFLMVVSEKHDVPLDQLCRADFRFALNGQLIAGDFSIVRSVSLEVGDELAIMPPVTGG